MDRLDLCTLSSVSESVLRLVFDADRLEPSKFLNHSCEPNCVVTWSSTRKQLVYKTSEAIKKGAELVICTWVSHHLLASLNLRFNP